jgi:benzylsuccinate CoA-transferase BbsF subunit
VLSFTTGIAGPNAARLLAVWGADVIKVESRRGGVDSFRHFGTGGDLDTSTRFAEKNLGVRSVTLNLKDPAGVGLARELASRSDVILDNYRPGVLTRLGLAPSDLHDVRSDLVIVQMPGLGATGPKSRFGSWGATLNSYSGITYLWNHPGQGRPIGSQGVYPDYFASVLTPSIVIRALLARKRTGRGAVIDLAQAEAAAYGGVGVSLLDVAVNEADPQPRGNTSDRNGPYGVYPCAGEDRWCAIAVETDGQWERLASAMGRSALVTDPLYATARARLQNREALDDLVAAWTREQEPDEVETRLQEVGVPAGAVARAEDLVRDEHLRLRGFLVTIDQPKIGPLTVAGMPIRLASDRLRNETPAPTIGQHNEEVLCGLLGHSREQLHEWEIAGTVA